MPYITSYLYQPTSSYKPPTIHCTMVKRVPTSPPAEDEPKYLTVVNPYPLYATMEQFEDQKDLVRWLSCCTGKDVLYTFFFKPSVGIVILEVDRHFDGYDRLLGAHKWSEFLKNPSDEEKDQVTKIFYCTYDTGCGLRANGWKRVEIEEHWFHGWSANNISSPYPPSSYCEVPKENPTAGPLCRPLPAASFPLHHASVTPVCLARRRQAKAGAAFSADQKLSKPMSAAEWTKGAPKSQSCASRSGNVTESEAFTARNTSPTCASITIAKSASKNPCTKVSPTLKSSAQSLASSITPTRSSALTMPHSVTDLHEDEDEDKDDLLPSVRSLVPSALNSDMTPESLNVRSQRDGRTENAHVPEEADDGTPPWSNYAMPREDKLLPWKQSCPLHNVLCKAGVCEMRMTAAAAKRKEEERLQRQKEREDRAHRKEAKKRKVDKSRGGSEDCPWDDVPSTANKNEDAEDAQAMSDQANKNEQSPCVDTSDGKNTTPSMQNGDAKGKDVAFNSGNVDPCSDSHTTWGDEVRCTVSSVARTANAKECSNNSTAWDNSTPGANVNSTSGYPATDNEVDFARGQRSNFPSPWDASVKSGAGSRAPSVASRSGWMKVSKGPW